ncbi:MAG: CFI-box-CTERM domain-containing protein [Bdellovibrio sp.]
MWLWTSTAQAALTALSIAGASATDSSEVTKPIIYAGFTTGCTSDGASNTTTCNSCTGAENNSSKLWTCNYQNAYPNLKLVITLQSDSSGQLASNAYMKLDDNTVGATFTYSGNILTAQVTWSELCAEGGYTSCTGNGSFQGTLTVGFTASGTTTAESMTFKIIARVATDGSDWAYADCMPRDTDNDGVVEDATAITGSGFCHFEAYRGDEKIYADNLYVSDTSYPASTASSVDYSGVVFFYEAVNDGESESDALARLSNSSASYVISTNTASTPPLADNRITGLTNGVKYCMAMANQDLTGVISYFTPLPGTTDSAGGTSPVTSAELCTVPTKVIGLLDDKSCFIATAAFGSDMAPEVQSFRDFRNQFLLTSSWGKSFVKFYYEHSPYYANLIAQSELAKGLVRLGLWPLLVFAKMSVAFGFWAALGFLVAFLVTARELWRRFFFGKLRGEM